MPFKHQPTRIGRAVRIRRQHLGWSINELSRQASIDVAVVHRIESGEIVQPSAPTLTKLAGALQMPLADAYAAAGYVVPQELPSFRPYLRARYGQLPDTALKQLDDFFDAMRNQYGASDGPLDGEDETPE